MLKHVFTLIFRGEIISKVDLRNFGRPTTSIFEQILRAFPNVNYK